MFEWCLGNQFSALCDIFSRESHWVLPSCEERYNQVFESAFQTCISIMTTLGPKNESAALHVHWSFPLQPYPFLVWTFHSARTNFFLCQCLSFLCRHSDLILSILRSPFKEHPEALRKVALCTHLLASVAQLGQPLDPFLRAFLMGDMYISCAKSEKSFFRCSWETRKAGVSNARDSLPESTSFSHLKDDFWGESQGCPGHGKDFPQPFIPGTLPYFTMKFLFNHSFNFLQT